MARQESPSSWRSHRCHGCGKRTSRSRCAECRAALNERKMMAGDQRAMARARRRAQHQRRRNR